MAQGVLGHPAQFLVGLVVTGDDLRHRQQEKHHPAAALQDEADIDEADDPPLRHAAVKAAGGEEAEGEQQQQQYHDTGGPGVDALLADAEFYDEGDGGKAGRQDDEVARVPAHGQDEKQRHHADAGGHPEQPLLQADMVVKNDLQPFFYHAMSSPFLGDRPEYPYSPAILSQTSR